jgi:large subunit ribosomal protein L4
MTPPAPTAAVITGGAKAKLAADVFALPRNDALVHQVVTAELAARRQGTHSTKTRGLVAGGRSNAADGTLVVADAGSFDAPQTKKAAGLAADHNLATPLVVVTAAGEEALEKSFRNLHRTHVVPVGALEVAEVVWARSLVVTKAALSALEGSSE